LLDPEQDCDSNQPPSYVSTCLPRNELPQGSSPKIYAIDCEMVRTTERFELARISLLQLCPTMEEPEKYKVVLDVLVKPKNNVLDYVTKYSGITASMLENVSTTLEEVQASLLAIIYKNDIIIGQSLENDLKALRIVHMNVIDTAVLFRSDGGRKHSLKHLSAVLLQKKIQDDPLLGHCSEEDAAAALLLAVRRGRLGDGFKVHERGGRKNLFSVITRMRREPEEKQSGFLKANRGPLVCIGPNEWIRDHVASQSIVNALQCEDIASSAVNAVTSYLRPGGRRASLLWSKLSIDRAEIDADAANAKVDAVIVSIICIE